MSKHEDPRLAATRDLAMDAALSLLQEKGVLAVTHAAISAETGISRSTLYRHWPVVEKLRNDAFLRAATSPEFAPKTNGPLRVDLIRILGNLLTALNNTPWGKIAPQVIAAAATDEQARTVINDFMQDRISNVEAVFLAADARGELRGDVPIQQLIEMAIAVPYFRKLIAGLPLDHGWLELHVDQICYLATRSDQR
jgi:AcrR family transcriptional regulator